VTRSAVACREAAPQQSKHAEHNIDGASNKKQTENNERTYVPEQLVAALLEAQLLSFVPQAIVASAGCFMRVAFSNHRRTRERQPRRAAPQQRHK